MSNSPRSLIDERSAREAELSGALSTISLLVAVGSAKATETRTAERIVAKMIDFMMGVPDVTKFLRWQEMLKWEVEGRGKVHLL